MTAKRKRLVYGIVSLAIVVIVISAAVINWNIRMRTVQEAKFYSESFLMQATADPKLPWGFNEPDWGTWATLFWRVEYVDEFPPEAERKWAVVYIKPDKVYNPSYTDNTQSQINILNSIIEDDPSIAVSRKLTLPLTKEQVLSNPDDVLMIIKQLDRRQWDIFYDHYMLEGAIDVMAKKAGIKVPEK